MASKGVNKVILVGNLGQDPDIRVFQNGDSVANITIATSETWKDRNTGEQREKTEWHKVTMFRKLAEIAGQYLKKGSKVYIEGSLKTRKWQDKTGNDRYVTEVHANIMQILESLKTVENRSTVDNQNVAKDNGNNYSVSVNNPPNTPSYLPAHNSGHTVVPPTYEPRNTNKDDDWDDIPF